MNTTNIARALPTDAFLRAQSSTRARLTHRGNSEILCERAFIAVTIGIAAFLSSICYHALQNYRAL